MGEKTHLKHYAIADNFDLSVAPGRRRQRGSSGRKNGYVLPRLDSHIIGTEQGNDLLRERVGLREVRVEDSA